MGESTQPRTIKDKHRWRKNRKTTKLHAVEKAENHRLIKIKGKFETLRRPRGTVLKVLKVLLQSFSRHSEAQQSFQN